MKEDVDPRGMGKVMGKGFWILDMYSHL